MLGGGALFILEILFSKGGSKINTALGFYIRMPRMLLN